MARCAKKLSGAESTCVFFWEVQRHDGIFFAELGCTIHRPKVVGLLWSTKKSMVVTRHKSRGKTDSKRIKQTAIKPTSNRTT